MSASLSSARARLLMFSGHVRIRQCRPSSGWTSKDTRTAFIQFFKDDHKHDYYPSSSVIPPKGSGTFFTNAGMNQFKSLFLGTTLVDSPLDSLQRAVNSQKCIRLGGKHNDLADVGHDTTHHTFFEMLGNWSFGDYFKKQAMLMAWELMTKVYLVPEDRLYVTYFGGEPALSLPPDYECRDLWLEIGVDKNRVVAGSLKDNFWDMGDTGPCGPCTEIHYDFIGGRDARHLVNADNPDVVELWNLVFMQFNRLAVDEIELLPKFHVDTGMGLERLVSVLQHKRSNYDTDLFEPLLNVIAQNSACGKYTGNLLKQTDISYRVVADHARMMCISIADGILPANQGLDGLSYKLRQIMHRLFRHQRKFLSCPPMSASQLVDPVVDTLGEAFPELAENYELIKSTVEREEGGYWKLISDAYSGMREFVDKYPDVKLIKGDDILRLGDLCGDLDLSSHELIADAAEHFGLTLDCTNLALDNSEVVPVSPSIDSSCARVSSKLAAQISKAGIPATDDSLKYGVNVTTDGTYEWSSCEGKVLAISHDDCLVDTISADHHSDCLIITDNTCFYSEAGGQDADRGAITGKNCVLVVTDVQTHGQYVLHKCRLESGNLNVGDEVTMDIDQTLRTNCALNHSCTHILYYSIQSMAKFSGDLQCTSSSVTSDGLSLSVTCQNDVTLGDISEISHRVNQWITTGNDVTTLELPFSSVRDVKEVTRLTHCAYSSTVRVVGMGPLESALENQSIDFPADLCGGTHVCNTSDIKAFVLTGMSGQSVKKLSAITGEAALASLERMKWLETFTSQLIQDVTENIDANTWESRLKEVYQAFSEADRLPKTDRENLLSQFEGSRVPQKIRARKNSQAKDGLQKMVVEALQCHNNTNPLVLESKFKSGMEVGKLLMKLSPPVPVVVQRTDAKRGGLLVCYCPSSTQDHSWPGQLAAAVAGDLLHNGKKMPSVYIIKTIKDVGDLHDLIDKCVSHRDSSVI